MTLREIAEKNQKRVVSSIEGIVDKVGEVTTFKSKRDNNKLVERLSFKLEDSSGAFWVSVFAHDEISDIKNHAGEKMVISSVQSEDKMLGVLASEYNNEYQFQVSNKAIFSYSPVDDAVKESMKPKEPAKTKKSTYNIPDEPLLTAEQYITNMVTVSELYKAQSIVKDDQALATLVCNFGNTLTNGRVKPLDTNNEYALIKKVPDDIKPEQDNTSKEETENQES